MTTATAHVPQLAKRDLVVGGLVSLCLIAFVLMRLWEDTDRVVLMIMLASFAPVSVWLAVIDARTHRLPNRVVLPALGAIVLMLGVEALIHGSTATLMRALLGGLISFLLFWLIAIILPGSLGGGDVKFVAATGAVTAWISPYAAVVALFFSFLLAGLWVVIGMLLRRVVWKTSLPFGPFLAFGVWSAAALFL